MSAGSWQIQVGNDLSKQYTVEQLRRKHTNGVISDDVMCTRDRGATFISLGSVLQEDQPQKESSARKLGKINRVSRLKPTAPQAKSVATDTAGSGLHRPSDPPSGNQPPSSVSAIFRAPRPAPPKTEANPVLNSLIADAANSVSEDEADEYAAEEPEEEIYRIPPPPAQQPRPLSFPDDTPSAPADFPKSAIAQAAAAALELHDQEADSEPIARPQPRPGQQPRGNALAAEADLSDDVIPVFGNGSDSKTSVLRLPLTILTIALGIAAVAVMIWWQKGGNGPPRFEELTGASFNFSSDSPATLEELHARTQILGVRVGQIQKALTSGDTEATDDLVVIPELPEVPRMPFVPFQRRTLSSEEQQLADDLLEKYSTLVQIGGPDGRNHDNATVTTYTEYLKQLISTVGARGESRSEVLHELSELTKLVYLLQLKNLRDEDSEAQQAAASILLSAANDGLAQVYSELATGDMRFADVFEREESSERARLLLIRYWHHRSMNRTSADEWLNQALELIDDEQRDYVKASIAEVSEIEK